MKFRDTDGEVHFPKICISENGNLRAVLQNFWEDEAENGGCYSLLHHARELEIVNNSQAIEDLVSYVGGRYPLDKHWQWKEPPRGIKVVIRQIGAELHSMQALREHFMTVVLNGVQVEGRPSSPRQCTNIAERALGSWN